MRIDEIQTWREEVPLTRPYTIATRTISTVSLFFVRARSGNEIGLGSASPSGAITGEHAEQCDAALLGDHVAGLVGHDLRHQGALYRLLKDSLGDAPAARAAVEMAFLDLFTRRLGIPVVDFLGRCHDLLPTSITIGIKSTEEALEEAEEYLSQGFRCLKVKVGHGLEEDLERLGKLRERVGKNVTIRIDGNQGYGPKETRELLEEAVKLDLELVEQPLPSGSDDELRKLPDSLRLLVAADESLHGERDALALARNARACGIFNIKLMKCGGISSALAIAEIAEAADIELMWGCNDESAIGISAALHAAYACPGTRYIDLDGSFDLARDPALGGFRIEDGGLRLLDEPGLGARLRD